MKTNLLVNTLHQCWLQDVRNSKLLPFGVSGFISTMIKRLFTLGVDLLAQ
jgi:hypothetical protein